MLEWLYGTDTPAVCVFTRYPNVLQTCGCCRHYNNSPIVASERHKDPLMSFAIAYDSVYAERSFSIWRANAMHTCSVSAARAIQLQQLPTLSAAKRYTHYRSALPENHRLQGCCFEHKRSGVNTQITKKNTSCSHQIAATIIFIILFFMDVNSRHIKLFEKHIDSID